MDKSNPMSLNMSDIKKILRDLVFFFLVPASFYITQIYTTINQTGHVLTMNDFIPSNVTMIAIVSWLCNQALNAIRKFIV